MVSAIQDVIMIRKRLLLGDKGIDIAKDYNCHRATISAIKQNKIWRTI